LRNQGATDEPGSPTKAVPSSPMPGVFPETSAAESTSRELDSASASEDRHQKQIIELQHEVSEWQSKHLAAMESMKASETQLLATISDLETSMRNAEAQHAERLAELEQKSKSIHGAAEDFDQEKTRHGEVVAALQKEVDEHKATAATHATRLAELEQSHANILRQVEEDSRSRELTEKELQTHRSLVANLENQIEEHKSAIAIHQQGLSALQESHTNELKHLNNQLLIAHTESNEKLVAQLAEHTNATAALQEELTKAQALHQDNTLALQAELTKAQTDMVDLLKGVSAALNEDTDATKLHSQIESLVKSRKTLTAQYEQASKDLDAARAELVTAVANVTALESTVGELKSINEQTLKELEKVSEEEKKSSRLVQELEDQLNQNWDQHELANNRLSALQSERQVQLEEALQTRAEIERELDESRAKIALLEVSIYICYIRTRC